MSEVCHTCSSSVLEHNKKDKKLKDLSDAELIVFSREYVSKIQRFGCSPKQKRCIDDVVKQGKSRSSATAICKSSIEKASKDDFGVDDILMIYELVSAIDLSPDVALDTYRAVYKKVLALKKKPVKNLEDIESNNDKLWPLKDKLWNAEREFKRSTTVNTDKADEALLKVRLEAREMVETYEKKPKRRRTKKKGK